MREHSIREYADAAQKAALEAGSILRDEFNRAGGPRGTEHHADADTEAERLIRKRLTAEFAETGFLGEELGPTPPRCKESRKLWVVDPNDGTAAYMKGFRGSAVSIALLDGGEPLVGVVYAFNHPDDRGDLISWYREGPVLRNGRAVERTWPERPGPECTVLLSHHADKNPPANARCTAPMRYRAVPSIAYRLALVAAGEGDAAVSLNSPVVWDVAGGHAVLYGAGGDLYTVEGTPVRYSPDGECTRSAWVFGGPGPLVEPLLRSDWSAVFERPSLQVPYTLCRPQRGGGPLDPGVLSRAQGCLLGQLAGDALGGLVEFQSAERIRHTYPEGVRRLEDGGTWNTLAGQPTDDSEMALLLARILVEHGRYDARAARDAYTYWLDSDPFDCGMTISAALRGRPNPESQANGALMRVSPLGVFGWNRSLEEVAEWAEADAAITHPHPVCREADALFAMALARAVRNAPSPRELYSHVVEWARNVSGPLNEAVHAAAHAPPPGYLHQQGWVLIALQNALWQLLHAGSLEEGVVDTVMRGGDTDTNAAICGALLGAVYGREAVPAQWRARLFSCRPISGLQGVSHPRPECFWPVDVLILAERLVRSSAGGK